MNARPGFRVAPLLALTWLLLMAAACGPSVYVGEAPATTVATAPGSPSVSALSSPLPAPSPSVNAEPTAPASCIVTISNRLVDLLEQPEHFAQTMMRIPPGDYPVLDARRVEWVDQMERWFQIQVGPSVGWLQDTTFNIATKTDACLSLAPMAP